MKVLELIDALKKYPPDMDVVIWDADTDWLLNIKEISRDDHGAVLPCVAIGGKYHGENCFFERDS